MISFEQVPPQKNLRSRLGINQGAALVSGAMWRKHPTDLTGAALKELELLHPQKIQN